MDVQDKVWSVLEEVIDPELHVNIVDLGLVYGLDIDGDANAEITMTLTVPECPLQDTIVKDVTDKVESLPEIRHAHVHLVWEPKWTPAKMNDQAIEEFKRRQSMMQ